MKMLNVLLSICLILAVAGPTLAGECLGVLEIRGVDALSQAVFELTRATGDPVPKEAASLMLYGALGTMPGMGISPNGTVRVVWFASDEDAGSFALLLPVENHGDDYLASLASSGWSDPQDLDNGLSSMVAPPGTPLPWPKVVFARRGATLIAAGRETDVRSADELMAALPPVLAAEGVVALEIRPSALIRAFGVEIIEGMEQAIQATAGQVPDSAKVADLYVKSYMALTRQIGEFVLGLGVADGNLNLHTRLAAEEGTRLARWLDTLKTPGRAASVVNLPDALYTGIFQLGDVAMVAEPYFQLMDQLMNIMPVEMPADTMAEYMQDAKAFWMNMTGDLGFSVLPPTRQNPLRAAEYIALKDVEDLRGRLSRMVSSAGAMIGAMAKSEAQSPIQAEIALEEPREYREIPVDRLAYRLTPGEALLGIWPPDRPLNLAVEIAWLPNAALVSIGGGDITEAMLDRILDQSAQHLATLPSWRAFYPAIDANPIQLSQLAVFDTLRHYLGLADLITGDDAAAEIPDGPGHLAELSYTAMNGVMSRARFRLADIAAIAAKVQEAQERARAAHAAQMSAFEELMSSGAFQVEFDDEDSGTSWDPGFGWDMDNDWDDEDEEDDWSDEDESDDDEEMIEPFVPTDETEGADAPVLL